MSPSRIDELRRRVQNDPASIAFAQLAEEYRRSGQTDEAVRVCREGLTRHPGYLSARVTLGRALLDLGQLGEARGEFEFVVAEAPENLAAVRGLAEIFHRDGHIAEALTYYQRALALARHDPEIEEIVQQLSRQAGVAASGPGNGLSFEEAHRELLSAADRVPLAAPAAPTVRNAAEGSTAPFDFDRLVAALGSPAAPPQVEAAVAGHPAPAIELPDAGDLGPNPFAALEAELRAHEALPAQPAARERPWEPASTVPEPLLADTPAPEMPLDAVDSATFEEAATEAAVEAMSGEAVGVPEDAAVARAGGPPEALTAADVLEDTMLAPAADLAEPATQLADTAQAVDFTEPVAAAGLETGAVPSPAQPANAAAPKEDLLDDLESWLNTLHDRTAE